jgi:FKBP-type peptidyl-prolyl cis-trans isomerase FkpA
MIHKYPYIFLLLFTAGLFQACGDSHKKTTKNVNIQSKAFQDKLIEANKMYVKKESDEIDQYVAHRGWQMTTTGTGLRYMIIKKGTGKLADDAQRAMVNFKISLLDGTLCYSSDSTGAKEFLIGQDDVESGIHEGIKYMHVGDKAILILPSHLAHGLTGDAIKIPPHASIIYELELLSLR